jgi:molybdate transport system ATP-binding protein
MTLQVSVQTARSGGFSLDVQFSVPPGITALLGPSGAGKTTTLRVIAGLERAAKATITLGTSVWQSENVWVAPQGRRVGFVFQSLALFPHLTARQNVAFGAGGADPLPWLERFHVAPLADRLPASFSGGEAQRVALARAMARSPQVLLLDEPFSSLDAALRDTLRAELAALVAETKVPTVLVTHDEAEARQLSAQVVRLEAGRVTARGEVPNGR